MRIKFIVSAAAFVFAACLNATVVFAGSQYVGGSEVTRDGNSGVLLFNADCAQAHKGSSWCTSKTIIEGGAKKGIVASDIANCEWVHPYVVAWDSQSNVLTDFSLEQSDTVAKMACSAWTSSANDKSGLALCDNGGGRANIDVVVCSVPREAACCK